MPLHKTPVTVLVNVELIVELLIVIKEFNILEVLNIWRSAARDIMLAALREGDLTRYGSAPVELIEKNQNLTWQKSLTWQKLITRAQEMINANVNPRLALENLLINL